MILIDSGTTDPITLSLYREWSSSGAVSIIPFNVPFNYSTACNLGASSPGVSTCYFSIMISR